MGAYKGVQRAAMESAMGGISGEEIASKSNKIRQFCVFSFFIIF